MKIWYFLLNILLLLGTFDQVFSKQITSASCSITTTGSEIVNNLPPMVDQETPINICQWKIITNINNRYATTVSTTKVTNRVNATQRYTYFAAIPNNAFLTGFVMDIDGKNYTSYIADNKKARGEFKNLVSTESSASTNVRDSQKFSFSVDLKPNSHSSFYLTYEELLARERGYYHDVVNIYPGQLVDDLHVEISIKDSNKISNAVIPNLHSGNEIENNNEKLESHAFISVNHDDGVLKSQTILLKMNKTVQRQLIKIMKTDENSGFGGQFDIKYDVGNREQFGEIIISENGYFTIFFTPKGLDPITKHVVFVLDVSGSMKGHRLKKLKEAMEKMLNQLHENDLISLERFNNIVKVSNLKNSKKSVKFYKIQNLERAKFPKPDRATSDNIKSALTSVKTFEADSGTNILLALKVGLRLVESGRKFDDVERQPLIMFLTDGKATLGEKSPEKIKEEVSKLNQGLRKSTISTISFGSETDQNFLKSLALLNKGFFKHVYDEADANLQIENFFDTISVPVLTDIKFKYDSSANRSDTKFPICYDGSELTVTGRYDKTKGFKPPEIEALSAKGPLKGQVLEVYNSTDDISHLWAFTTVNQLLDKIKVNANNKASDEKKVLDVGLKYSFVTPYSSMVFVKPEGKFVLGTDELLKQ